jgi:predicted ABC-type transport system involved in lysophospholipase L1 biosynthesis ATPase subunit
MIVPRRIGVWAVLVLASFAAVRAEEAAGLPVPVEEKRVLEDLAAGKADDAIAALPAAVGAREAQATIDAKAAAGAIDDLAAAVFSGAGGSEAATVAAEAALKRALALRGRIFGEHALETAKSCTTLSDFAFMRGRWDDAESWERRALAIRRDAVPADPLAVARSLDGLGVVLVRQGRLADAEPLLSEAVRLYDADPAAGDARLEARNSLAELYRQQDRLEESEHLFREAIAAAEQAGPDGAALLARLANNLGGLLKDEGKLAEAETLNHRSLALRESAPHPDPADLSVAYLNLAEIYRLEGNAAEAEPLYLKSIELAKLGLGPDHPDLATHLGQLGVLYRDTDLTQADEGALTAYRREHVGFVFQFYNLIPSLTVRENVALVTDIARDPMPVDDAIERVGLTPRRDHFPAQLSGGEQQRVAIARALSPRPQIILADEPTGNLDGKTGEQVVDLLFGLQRRRQATLILVTHDLALAGRCGRLVRMADGMIAGAELATA